MHLPLHCAWHRQHIQPSNHHPLQHPLPVRHQPLSYREKSPPVDCSRRLSGLILIFVEIPLLLRICPTSEKFDVFIRRFTTNYMRAIMYSLMSLVQWLSLTQKTTSLIAAAVLLLAAAICYLIAGLKGQGFVGSKTLGGQGVVQMIV